MSLVVVGSTVLDIIITQAPRLPAWPRHSEFTSDNLVLLTHAPLVTLGGNGANAAYVAACSGAQVDLQTNLGEDPFGAVARGWMTAAGCRFLRSGKNQRTAINLTAANARHSRATFFYPGDAPSLPKRRDLPAGLTHFLVCGWPHPPLPQLERFFRALKRQGVFTVMDTGPFLGKIWSLKELQPTLASLDLLLTNEHELTSLTRTTDLSFGLQKLRKYFPGHIVVKRGRQGALWLPESLDAWHKVPASRVKTVNTVGAGDSFNGALLAALVLKKEFAPALDFAVKTAAKVVASQRGVLGVR